MDVWVCDIQGTLVGPDNQGSYYLGVYMESPSFS